MKYRLSLDKSAWLKRSAYRTMGFSGLGLESLYFRISKVSTQVGQHSGSDEKPFSKKIIQDAKTSMISENRYQMRKGPVG